MAQRFNFSLQKILEVRQRIQDQKVSQLNAAQMAWHTASEQLTMLETEKTSALEEARKELPDNIQAVKIREAYFKQLDAEIKQQQASLEKLREEVDQARTALKKASQEKRSVEILKEKALIDYQKKQRSRQEMIDSEIALRKRFFETEESGGL